MNKFPHLKKYLELLLHISAWLILLGLVSSSIQNYWTDLYRQSSPDLSFEEYFPWGEFYQWKGEHWNLHPYLYYTLLILFKALFFYINVYLIFPRYQHIQPAWKISKPIFFNFLWCFAAEVLLFQFTWSTIFSENNAAHWLLSYNPFPHGIVPYIMLVVASFGYWSARQWLLNKEDIQKLGKTSAELALLKNQVNPHFLFNTLNNLFSMAIERHADDLAESISQLTHMMRYTIYDSRVEYIELHREVAYLENYIKLQKLRFTTDDAVSIRFQVVGDTQSVRIAPMLLINFVENAFKHGVSLKHPSLLNITLTTTAEQIAFTVENTIHRQNSENLVQHAGFGLEHTKKLLQMQYPHRHQLQITEENNIYKVALVLKLQKTKVEVMA